MKPLNKIFSALAVTVALSSAVYAADPGAQNPHHGGAGAHGHPSATTLGLTGDLATQWDAINAQEKTLHQQQFSEGASALNDAISALSSPNADLAALAKQKDAREDTRRDQERALRDQRLALYKTMNATQQTAVRTLMLQKLTNMQDHMAQMQEHAAAHAAAKAQTPSQ